MITPPPEPIDAVQMKQAIQKRIARETEGMTREEYWRYIRRGAEEFRKSQRPRPGGLKAFFEEADRGPSA